MVLSLIKDIITKVLDISIVWFLVYFVLKNLKNNIKMVLIFKVLW